VRTHILAFRPDPAEPDAWIADLACGHTQHVRHQPPFRERPWVLTPEGRARFIGTEVDCPEPHPEMDTQEGECPAVW
jgi:Protein of unknown function (DUF3565)